MGRNGQSVKGSKIGRSKVAITDLLLDEVGVLESGWRSCALRDDRCDPCDALRLCAGNLMNRFGRALRGAGSNQNKKNEKKEMPHWTCMGVVSRSANERRIKLAIS